MANKINEDVKRVHEELIRQDESAKTEIRSLDSKILERKASLRLNTMKEKEDDFHKAKIHLIICLLAGLSYGVIGYGLMSITCRVPSINVLVSLLLTYTGIRFAFIDYKLINKRINNYYNKDFSDDEIEELESKRELTLEREKEIRLTLSALRSYFPEVSDEVVIEREDEGIEMGPTLKRKNEKNKKKGM